MHRDPLTARLRRFGTTVFTEMSALAHAHDAVNLGQGFPDFDAPEPLKKAAMKAIADGSNQYAPGNGLPRLRRAIAAHLADHHQLDVDADTEVTVTTGATEAVYATLAGLLDVGDEVVLLEPSYDVYEAAVAMAGGVVRPVPLRAEPDGGWRLHAPDLDAVVGPATKAIIVNTPHNPVGKVFDDDELGLVVAAAERVDAAIISDEVYEHLTFDRPHRSVCHVPGGIERTVRVSSAAKTFSVTGWKVGWASAPAHLTDVLRAAKQWTTFTSGTPFQHAVAGVLGQADAHLEAMAADYRRRRDLLCEGLEAIGFDVTVPEGTFFVPADARPLGFDDDVDLCRRLPVDVGVGAIPISVFHQGPPATSPTRGLVRFAFCKTDDALREGLARLEKGLPGMSRHPATPEGSGPTDQEH